VLDGQKQEKDHVNHMCLMAKSKKKTKEDEDKKDGAIKGSNSRA